MSLASLRLALGSSSTVATNLVAFAIRHHFVDKYCSVELKEYRKIFRATDEVRFQDLSPLAHSLYRKPYWGLVKAGQLDNISRRFSWFRKLLSTHDEEVAPIFPDSWKVGQNLVARFADITKCGCLLFCRSCVGADTPCPIRDDLSAALGRVATLLTVAVLLEALQITLDFETSISVKYGVPVSTNPRPSRLW